MDKESGYVDAMAEEALEDMQRAIEQREREWETLAAFIKSEAEYAAREVLNRNGCSDELRRSAFEEDARKAFMGEEP
jgi:hypothetical protein